MILRRILLDGLHKHEFFLLYSLSSLFYTNGMFSKEFTLSKRHLGIILLVIGIVGFIVIIGIDVIRAGREGGIGPAQQFALGAMLLLALIGASLIPLGDDPA